MKFMGNVALIFRKTSTIYQQYDMEAANYPGCGLTCLQ